MRILHVVGHSLVRYTPSRIATYWGRYTEHDGLAIAFRREAPDGRCFHHFYDTVNPYGYLCLKKFPKKELDKILDSVDVIHCHDDVYPTRDFPNHIKGKVLVYQAHIGNIPERYFRRGHRLTYDGRVRHAGITNGYGHLFDEDEALSNGKRRWGRLPDILDLNHPAYLPDPGIRIPLDTAELHICYTYSNVKEGEKINAKRPHGHRKLVHRVPKIVFKLVGGVSFEEAMAEKKRAHVVLEEVFTPYLHLSALEGAAVGAMVLTNYNDYTRNELCRAVGSPVGEFPFFHCTTETLPDVLSMIRRNRYLVSEWGEKARNWMLKYYQPEKLLDIYLRFYGIKAQSA